jgi:predicted RNA-binding Zn-ribbon protein involved in translation (DUF1610 family)
MSDYVLLAEVPGVSARLCGMSGLVNLAPPAGELLLCNWQLLPKSEVAIAADMLRDIPRLHERKCWGCGRKHWHCENHGKQVACPECGSMDTRADAATIKRLNNL